MYPLQQSQTGHTRLKKILFCAKAVSWGPYPSEKVSFDFAQGEGVPKVAKYGNKFQQETKVKILFLVSFYFKNFSHFLL